MPTTSRQCRSGAGKRQNRQRRDRAFFTREVRPLLRWAQEDQRRHGKRENRNRLSDLFPPGPSLREVKPRRNNPFRKIKGNLLKNNYFKFI